MLWWEFLGLFFNLLVIPGDTQEIIGIFFVRKDSLLTNSQYIILLDVAYYFILLIYLLDDSLRSHFCFNGLLFSAVGEQVRYFPPSLFYSTYFILILWLFGCFWAVSKCGTCHPRYFTIQIILLQLGIFVGFQWELSRKSYRVIQKLFLTVLLARGYFLFYGCVSVRRKFSRIHVLFNCV